MASTESYHIRIPTRDLEAMRRLANATRFARISDICREALARGIAQLEEEQREAVEQRAAAGGAR